MESKHIIGFLVGIIILVGGIAFIAGKVSPTENGPQSPFDLDAFATCLKDKGATFYGAFWCPHCQATKKIFGEAAKKLPYVECSTPDGRGQTPICIQKGIQSYPTWVFADGKTIGGELSLDENAGSSYLSLKDLSVGSGCPLIPRDGSAPIYPETASSTATTTQSTATTTPKATSTSSKAR